MTRDPTGPERLIDVVIGAGLAGLAVIVTSVAGQLGTLPGSACAVALCALVALRRRALIAVLAAAVLCAAIRLTHGQSVVNEGLYFLPSMTSVAVLSHSLGQEVPPLFSLPALAALIAGLSFDTDPWNPLLLVLSIGPWLGGCLMASRQRAVALLSQQAKELVEERELFARETVRFERARIARELHDIVAHNVSLMVVQAGAGERLTDSDPEGAVQAFGSIAEAARQADEEISRLVGLLRPASGAPSGGSRLIEELVLRAERVGLPISLSISGDIDDAGAAVGETMTRAVQEGITNAMKHAPGAVVSVRIKGTDKAIELEISNVTAPRRASGMEGPGGGHGLAGMRERVLQCGGSFSAGAGPLGGWEIAIRLPRRPALRSLGEG